MASRILEARGLSKSYGVLHAVKGVSLEVFEGECVGILGPRGSGKTTLLKLLYGGIPLHAGDVFVCGLNLKTSLYHAKPFIGVVPQDGGLDPDFTILDNMILFGQYFDMTVKAAKVRALTLLRKLDMENRAHQLVQDLPADVQRKLLLARALVPSPRILFLDEPTAGFEARVRLEIWDFLKEVRAANESLSIVLSTHGVQEAELLCDRVAIFNRGEVLKVGTPRSLIEKYVGDHVVEFSCRDHEVRYFSSQLKDRFDIQVFRNRIRVYNVKPEDIRDYFSQLQVDTLLRRGGNLEDVYFKLSGLDLSEEILTERELML